MIENLYNTSAQAITLLHAEPCSTLGGAWLVCTLSDSPKTWPQPTVTACVPAETLGWLASAAGTVLPSTTTLHLASYSPWKASSKPASSLWARLVTHKVESSCNGHFVCSWHPGHLCTLQCHASSFLKVLTAKRARQRLKALNHAIKSSAYSLPSTRTTAAIKTDTMLIAGDSLQVHKESSANY